MSELKTLKDINWLMTDEKDNVIATDTKQLRQEAIKWVKHLVQTKKLTEKEKEEYYEITGEWTDIVYTTPIYNECNIEIIDWIKHFFNITEEETK